MLNPKVRSGKYLENSYGILSSLLEEEIQSVMTHFHSSTYDGHASKSKTVAKFLQVVLYWPNLFEDVYLFIIKRDQCQCTRNISKRNDMDQNNILQVDIFYVWRINCMGPFPSSMGNKYIRIAIEYVLKWIDVISSPTNGTQVVSKVFKNIISQGLVFIGLL